MNRTAHPTDLLSATGYQVRVWLLDVEPLVWRRFLIRSDQTFADLHAAIQIMFGWRNEQPYRFHINGAAVGSAEMLEVWTTEAAKEVWLAVA